MGEKFPPHLPPSAHETQGPGQASPQLAPGMSWWLEKPLQKLTCSEKAWGIKSQIVHLPGKGSSCSQHPQHA